MSKRSDRKSVTTLIPTQVVEKIGEIKIRTGAHVNDLIVVAVLLSESNPKLFSKLLKEARRVKYAKG